MTRKIIKSTLFVFILLVAGLQVYAASLNTNIVDLLIQKVNNIGTKYMQQADESMASEAAIRDSDLDSYVSDALQQADSAIKAHTENELSRAYASVDSYSNELKTEASGIINSQVDQKKQEITVRIDNSIAQAKQDIENDFEKILNKPD